MAVTLDASRVEAVAERAPDVVGIKHAGKDLALVTGTLRRLGPGFRVFVGWKSCGS